jgi:exodeoxyribonuclease V alpha subunit
MSSLKDMLKPKATVSGPGAGKPSPVSQEPSSTPTPPVPLSNNGKRVSLKDMLAAKPKPIPHNVPNDVNQTVRDKPSLRDLIRAKAEQTKPQQKAQSEEAITPASQPKSAQPGADAPPPDIADEVSYAGSSLTLQDKIAKMKQAELTIDQSFEPSPLSPESDIIHMKDRYGRPIDLNDKQASGAQMAVDGQSFVLTGEAGTGKSTTIEAVIASLLQHHRDKITDVSYRMNDRSGRRINGPSVCVCAYTRKAIGNVSRILSHNFELHAEMEGALQTIHNLLEYAPVIEWSEKQEREVKIFKPQRGQWDPLDITHLIIEEASMVGLDLWEELRAALKPNVQIIYVGDINQLPPVFGKSVMSYALTKLPIVHLDTVYRQALDNPIIAAAHAVLHGKPFTESKPALRWITGKSKVVQPEETMSRAMGRLFEIGLENKHKVEEWKKYQYEYETMLIADRMTSKSPKTDAEIKAQQDDHVSYDPEEDIVLIPFNKNAMGTRQINYRIAQHLGEQREAEVFEIIAGFEKHYLAVGDKVMVNKMEGVITRIASNMSYMGRKPMTPSVNLTRFGFYSGTKANPSNGDDDFGLDELDIDIEHTIEEEEERRQQSSHIVTCELETGQEISISSAGEFNQQIFQLGYALSIHKSQGSEWRRVFLLFHKNHSTMLSRELLYTAMTRAREELVIVARPELIKKATNSPRIKGNSLKQKIEYFNSGYLDEDIEVTV